MNKQPDPGHIMQTATAFWASKVLLTAVELGLFSTLADESMTAMQIGESLDIHPRGRFDFLDALVRLLPINEGEPVVKAGEVDSWALYEDDQFGNEVWW